MMDKDHPVQHLARCVMALRLEVHPSIADHITDAVSDVVGLLLDEMADGGRDTTEHPARLLVVRPVSTT